MKGSILLFLVILLLIAGCAEEEEQPEITIVIEEEPEEEIAEEAVQEPEEEPEEEAEFEGRIIELIATETEFIPSDLDIMYNESVMLLIRSNYTHVFYAPSLRLNEQIGAEENRIIVPTDRKGTHMFWCNASHYGLEHRSMNGRLRIE